MDLDNIHMATIRTIREITEDGKLEHEEVWNLADFLRTNPDAQTKWPGKKLWPIVLQVIEDDIVTNDEMRMLALEIADVEELCSEISAEETQIDKSSVLVRITATRLEIPRLDKTIWIQPHSKTERLLGCDLKILKCSCEDWKTGHSKLPEQNFGRLCKHLVGALLEAQEDATLDTDQWPEQTTNLLLILSAFKVAAEPVTNWDHIVWDDQECFLAFGDAEWCTVFADVGGGSFERFGFHLKENRWAYGAEPPDGPMVAAYLKEITLTSEEKIRGEDLSALTSAEKSGA
jgi:hypothetical protein